MPNKTDPIASLEALLFLHGEPATFEFLCSVLDIPAEVLHVNLDTLDARLSEPHRGLRLIRTSVSAQLVTSPEMGELLERIVKTELESDLTPAVLETLSVIAYLGPVDRAHIEYVRGVNSSFSLRNLLLRGLIERIQSPEHKNQNVYQIAPAALRHLGVKSASELPDYETLRTATNAISSNSESPSPVAPTLE